MTHNSGASPGPIALGTGFSYTVPTTKSLRFIKSLRFFGDLYILLARCSYMQLYLYYAIIPVYIFAR